jgi:hypothetical protein
VRSLRRRPDFDDQLDAVIPGRCDACGAKVTAVIRHGRPEELRHSCGNLWAVFNGLDVLYEDESALPPHASEPPD